MQVMASDADDPTYGSSARLVYSVLDGEHHFTVDPKTGEGRGGAKGVGSWGGARGVTQETWSEQASQGPPPEVCSLPSNQTALRVGQMTQKHLARFRSPQGRGEGGTDRQEERRTEEQKRMGWGPDWQKNKGKRQSLWAL